MYGEPTWTWHWLWHWTSGFSKATIFLLAFMFVHACVLLIVGRLRFRTQSAVVADLIAVVRGPSLAYAADRLSENTKNYIASMMAAGVKAFQFTNNTLTHFEAISVATRAMDRSESLAVSRLKSGTSTLATIAALAPFVGLAGTVIGLLDSFRGGSCTPECWIFVISSGIAVSLIPTAVALAVGVLALSFHNNLSRQLELFLSKCSMAGSAVIRFLHEHEAERGLLSAEALAQTQTREWEASYDESPFLGAVLVAVWVVWLYAFCMLGFALYWSLTHPQY